MIYLCKSADIAPEKAYTDGNGMQQGGDSKVLKNTTWNASLVVANGFDYNDRIWRILDWRLSEKCQ